MTERAWKDAVQGLGNSIAKRKSRCDAHVIHARFARDEAINLAARQFARNQAKEVLESLNTSVTILIAILTEETATTLLGCY